MKVKMFYIPLSQSLPKNAPEEIMEKYSVSDICDEVNQGDFENAKKYFPDNVEEVEFPNLINDAYITYTDDFINLIADGFFWRFIRDKKVDLEKDFYQYFIEKD